MYEFLFYAYVTCIGFCVAGIAASLSQLLTGRPLKFGLDTASIAPALLGVFTRVLAGPAIVMRNALAAAIRGRPPYWLALSTFISVVWSFFSGAVVLELAIRLPA